MKGKIEIEQSDLIELLVKKIKFLTEEYKNLHSAYKSHKGKIEIDPLVLIESHERFLKEHGDIDRILELYELFIKDDVLKQSRTNKKIEDKE